MIRNHVGNVLWSNSNGKDLIMVRWINGNPKMLFASFDNGDDVGICGWITQSDGSFVPVLELEEGKRVDLAEYCEANETYFVMLKLGIAELVTKSAPYQLDDKGMTIKRCDDEQIEIKVSESQLIPDRLTLERFHQIISDGVCNLEQVFLRLDDDGLAVQREKTGIRVWSELGTMGKLLTLSMFRALFFGYTRVGFRFREGFTVCQENDTDFKFSDRGTDPRERTLAVGALEDLIFGDEVGVSSVDNFCISSEGRGLVLVRDPNNPDCLFVGTKRVKRADVAEVLRNAFCG